MSKETIDVETIDLLLTSNERDDVAEAIRLIHNNYKEKIVEAIRLIALSADRDEIEDIYQNVLWALSDAANHGKYELGKTRLHGFIYMVAINKAKDWLRQKYAQKRSHDGDGDVSVDSMAEVLKDSGVLEPWEYAAEKEETTRILEEMKKSLPNLKTRQGQVAEIILINWPNFLSDREIKEEILRVHGEDVTTAAVKSARQEVYEKIRQTLSNSD
jgi:DNA-directed RNA polymerase specialized sigma24 family protein